MCVGNRSMSPPSYSTAVLLYISTLSACTVNRWMQKWAKRRNLSKRRRSNSKNKSVEERLPKIQCFRWGFRKLFKEPVRRKGHVLSETEPMGATAAAELRLAKYGQFQL